MLDPLAARVHAFLQCLPSANLFSEHYYDRGHEDARLKSIYRSGDSSFMWMLGYQWHVLRSTSSINDKPLSETGRISPIGSAGDVSHALAIYSMGRSKSTTTDP